MVESLVARALCETQGVQEKAARYQDGPAVFYQSAPHDKDAKWNGTQYPRVDYIIDWSYHPERKTAGVLSVNVWCLNESVVQPEELGEDIMHSLSDLFLTDESGSYCLVWNRTDPFDGVGSEPKTVGVTVSFDVAEFPLQGGGTPDPAASLALWIKQHHPNVKMIGTDELPSIWRASDAAPAVYVRISGGGAKGKASHAVSWLTASMIVHVISAAPTARQKLIREIAGELAILEEITCDDGSPLFLRGISYTTGANPLTAGQMTITGEYGVLRQYPSSDALNHIEIGGRNG